MDDKDQTSGLGTSGQGDGDQGSEPKGEPTETADAPPAGEMTETDAPATPN